MAVCAQPGCPVIVDRGYCVAHRPARADRHTPHARALASWRWRQYSRRYLQTHPLCVTCQATGRLVAAEVVDHIWPASQGGAMWHPGNHRPLCRACNSAKGASLGHGGLPASADDAGDDLVLA